MAAALPKWPSWQRFAELSAALTEDDVAGLSKVGKSFGVAVKDEVVVENAGKLLLAQVVQRSTYWRSRRWIAWWRSSRA